MSLLGRLLALLAIWRRLRSPAPPPRPELAPPPEPDVRERRVGSDPRAEALVAALLFAAGLAGGAFAVLYVADDDTQLLGAAAGLALACVAAALMLASLRVVPRERAVELRQPLRHPGEEESVADQLRAGVEGVSRRGLLAAAAGVAAAGAGALVVAPAASLGPRVDDRLRASPWRRGRLLVDEDDRPLAAADLEVGAFVTAFPQGADKRDLASPVVVAHLHPSTIQLPAARAGWAPQGFVAYSKICTHAGCAVSEFRFPLNRDTSRGPAFVCPCHYSTFDPAHGGRVLFGPAGRPLPQLPLTIAADGLLRAGGPFSDPAGPAWWGVP